MMVGDAEFRMVWLWGSAVSSSAAGRFGRSLAGLDVGLVDEAAVEEGEMEAAKLPEVLNAGGVGLVAGGGGMSDCHVEDDVADIDIGRY
jgi:hypothetical protein